MNIEQLYRDYGIPYVTSGHKHAREGWVNCPCPFCHGHDGYHLGYDTTDEKFVCWRCGGHSTAETLQALLHKSYKEVKEIINTYGKVWMKKPTLKRKIIKKKLLLPPTQEKLSKTAENYLKNRGFNPSELVDLWNLQSTAIISRIDGVDYRHRILIPYMWEGEVVSFDTRDVTGKASVRFLACKEEREILDHKKILYGRQQDWKEIGICVEGCADVWRIGVESFAVSGIKYTPAQVRYIARHFKKVAILFDNEPQARKQANKLVADLRFRGVDAKRIDLPEGKDPGELSLQEISEVKAEIKRIFVK